MLRVYNQSHLGATGAKAGCKEDESIMETDAIVRRAIENSASRNELWIKILIDLGCASVCEVGV